MMSTRATLLTLLWLGLVTTVTAQDYERTPVELRESPFFDGEVTFSTPDGKRTLNVSLKQLQLDGGARVELQLPENGMVVLQHRAGGVKLNAGQTEFEPLEGEWMTVDLPAGLTLSTEDDAALIDAIVISEH
jgi:hypothetical protein